MSHTGARLALREALDRLRDARESEALSCAAVRAALRAVDEARRADGAVFVIKNGEDYVFVASTEPRSPLETLLSSGPLWVRRQCAAVRLTWDEANVARADMNQKELEAGAEKLSRIVRLVGRPKKS